MKRRTFLAASGAAGLVPLMPVIASTNSHKMQPVLDYFKDRTSGKYGPLTDAMITARYASEPSVGTQQIVFTYATLSNLSDYSIVISEEQALNRLGSIHEIDFYERDKHRGQLNDYNNMIRKIHIQKISNMIARSSWRGRGTVFIRTDLGYIVTYASQHLLGDAGLVYHDHMFHTHTGPNVGVELENYFALIKGDPDDILETLNDFQKLHAIIIV